MGRRIRLLGGRMSNRSPADPLARSLERVLAEIGSRAPVSIQQPEHETKSGSVLSRVSGLVDPGWMEQRTVLIAGMGAVGLRISLLLAPYRMKQILIDYDVVELANVLHGRTPYAESDIGILKVFCARKKIIDINRQAKVTAHPRNINDFGDDELVHIAAQIDAGIIAIDDGTALLKLNRILYPRVRALYPAAHEQARSGQIIVTHPGSPCLECCIGARSGTDIQTLHGEPGLGIHFNAVSQLCAQLVVQELAARSGSPLGQPLGPEVSYIAISNMAGEISPQGPGTLFFRATRDPQCPVCGRP